MVKIVVDVKRDVIAIGGALHADGEKVLLENGSRERDLWGANFYPGNPPEERIEYSALINIRLLACALRIHPQAYRRLKG